MVCRISANQRSNYSLLDEIAIGSAPDILIVDADDADAVRHTNELLASNPRLPVVALYRGDVPLGMPNALRKRFIPVKLIPLLDGLRGGGANAPSSLLKALAAGFSAPSTEKATSVVAPTYASARPVALVVDDSLVVRIQIQSSLAELDIHAMLAANGAEAEYALNDKSIQMVLLDVVLPDSDGYQICKRIKRDRLLQHLPVVMLTSKSSPFDRVRGTLAGCDNYLTKPVDKARFRETVLRYLPSNAMSSKEHA